MSKLNDTKMKKLAMQLAKCDRSHEVKELLIKYGYWDNPSCWRDLGDNDSNWSIVGNQQSDALGSLVEKHVNQCDSILFSECLQNGVDPLDHAKAPKSVKDAKENLLGIPDGDISKLKPSERTKLAKKFAGLVVTGDRLTPTYTFFDHGEGQAPEKFPETFLGLVKSNKVKTSFVQGKFGMGGSGAIPFCGDGIQLIISRRNPNINDGSLSDDCGFTVTRKFEPTGNERLPVIRYLQIDGKIPKFSADQALKLLPKENNKYPCVEDWHHGAFIKLYDYDIGPTLRSIGSTDLGRKLGVKVVDPVIPIRIYERRNSGKKSPEETMNGLRTRLSADEANILESISPIGFSMFVEGQQLDVEINVLKEKYKLKNGEERKVDVNKVHGSTGVIFEVNGQSTGTLPRIWYRKTGLRYLEQSIITIVSCSNVNAKYQSDLFMPDRERIRKDSDFSREILERLQSTLSSHPGLKSLMEQRRREWISKASDNASVSMAMEIIKSSPSIYKEFIQGFRISSPINTGKNGGDKPKLQKNPTYFILEKPKKYSQNSPRAIEDGRRANICFLTDAPNDYLTRGVNKGSYKVSLDSVLMKNTPIFSPNDGIWNLNLELPNGSKVGQKFELEVEVSDPTQSKPFIIKLWVEKTPKRLRPSKPGKGKKKNGNGKGSNLSNKSFDLPPYRAVYKEKDKDLWERLGFNDREGGRILKNVNNGKITYDFYINMDNKYFQHSKKEAAKNDIRLVERIYKECIYMNLISLSSADRKGEVDDIEEASKICSKVLAQIAVPVVKHLSKIH